MPFPECLHIYNIYMNKSTKETPTNLHQLSERSDESTSRHSYDRSIICVPSWWRCGARHIWACVSSERARFKCLAHNKKQIQLGKHTFAPPLARYGPTYSYICIVYAKTADRRADLFKTNVNCGAPSPIYACIHYIAQSAVMEMTTAHIWKSNNS